MNYAALAFTNTIKKLQESYGSRTSYERVERMSSTDGLTSREIQFIGERDSFYAASFGENDYPYIQHRGGPKGFLKVLDEKTLAFLDYTGNKQYISLGNIQMNNHVALILVDYPRQARLKIYADAEVKSLEDEPAITKSLSTSDYASKAERIIIYKVKAFDWNCPQYITPRYTQEEVLEAIKEEQNYLRELEEENQKLKEQLGRLNNTDMQKAK